MESRLAMGSRSDSGLLLGWDLPSESGSRWDSASESLWGSGSVSPSESGSRLA